jgi:hypothetical protein
MPCVVESRNRPKVESVECMRERMYVTIKIKNQLMHFKILLLLFTEDDIINPPPTIPNHLKKHVSYESEPPDQAKFPSLCSCRCIFHLLLSQAPAFSSAAEFV